METVNVAKVVVVVGDVIIVVVVIDLLVVVIVMDLVAVADADAAAGSDDDDGAGSRRGVMVGDETITPITTLLVLLHSDWIDANSAAQNEIVMLALSLYLPWT